MDVVVAGARTSGGFFDIFVSEGGLPSNGNSTWNSTRASGIIGDKFVYIPFLQLSAACQAQLNAGAPCTLYVAVQGSNSLPAGVECLYMLNAQVSGSQVYPFQLSDGAPVSTFIPAHAYDYFYGLVNVPQQRSIFIVVQNLVGSTSLYMNLGNSSKTFWVAGGPLPDIYTPDMGGYERVDIFPPSAWPSFRELSAPAWDVSASTFRTQQADSAEAAEAATPSALGDARVVARLPSGGLVIEVSVAPETVPILDGEREVGALGRFSSAATRAHPENLASDPAPTSVLATKFREAREAEAAARARGEVMAPELRAEMARAGGGAPPPPQNRQLWCTGCMLFLTVAAQTDSLVSVSFSGGAAYQTLQSGLPVEGYAPRSDFSYYAFAATDPLQDVVISLQPVFGETDVYVAVQSPTYPNFMPGHFNNVWQLHPWTGEYQLVINHTDVNFCRPRDGSPVGAPCVFLIGVFARNNETATFTISAGSDSNNTITPLLDGAPYSGTVLEQQLQYFQFTLPYPVPPAQVAWTNLFGAVSSFVTNQFVFGVSANSLLPGPNSQACQWVGTNYSGMGMAPGDPCFNPLLNVYTIGVLGNSGVANLVSQFSVVASITGDATRLVYGSPTTNIFVPKTTNLLFTFEVLDLQHDLVVASSPAYGEVGLLVAPMDRENGTIPGCSMACSGCQVVCANYTVCCPGSFLLPPRRAFIAGAASPVFLSLPAPLPRPCAVVPAELRLLARALHQRERPLQPARALLDGRPHEPGDRVADLRPLQQPAAGALLRRALRLRDHLRDVAGRRAGRAADAAGGRPAAGHADWPRDAVPRPARRQLLGQLHPQPAALDRRVRHAAQRLLLPPARELAGHRRVHHRRPPLQRQLDGPLRPAAARLRGGLRAHGHPDVQPALRR